MSSKNTDDGSLLTPDQMDRLPIDLDEEIRNWCLGSKDTNCSWTPKLSCSSGNLVDRPSFISRAEGAYSLLRKTISQNSRSQVSEDIEFLAPNFERLFDELITPKSSLDTNWQISPRRLEKNLKGCNTINGSDLKRNFNREETIKDVGLMITPIPLEKDPNLHADYIQAEFLKIAKQSTDLQATVSSKATLNLEALEKVEDSYKESSNSLQRVQSSSGGSNPSQSQEGYNHKILSIIHRRCLKEPNGITSTDTSPMSSYSTGLAMVEPKGRFRLDENLAVSPCCMQSPVFHSSIFK